ncbi:dedicator of cytokinesis protein 4-like isoform X1 [Salvelinus alpinus]|uniref:dedicator of cytokinesis protein 4-like isoform X1 n=1 Tax=Salvelinus alpinus TaxID=8036 RepID=UPI0039FC1E31
MSVCSQAVFLRTFPEVYGELLKIFTVREVAGFVRETLGSLPATAHAECPLEAVKLHCIAKTVESQLYTNPESRCILLPVVLRLLQAHMQEQRDLVMCARILTSMLSLIRKDDSVTTEPVVSEEVDLIVDSLLVVLMRTILEITNRPQPAGTNMRLQFQDITVSVCVWVHVCVCVSNC